MFLSRALTVSGGVCAALLLGAAPASAAPPFESFDPFTLESTADAGGDGFCDFPVLLEVVADFHPVPPGDPDSTRFVGAGFVTATNTQTGESISFNISGPTNATTSPDRVLTFTGTGGQLAWTTVENSFAGVSPLTYTTGLLRFAVDLKDGTTLSYSARGRTVDVCAELAP